MPGRILFKTTPDGTQTPVEAMRIDSAQNVTLATGNLVIGTSGKGIDFSATPGTGTSELFDDYEEGTWTPVVADADTGGNVATSAITSGRYTKIGNVVTVFFEAYDINKTGMTAGNAVWIRGFPFANGSTQSANGVVDMRNTTFTVYPTVLLAKSGSAIRFFGHVSGGGVATVNVSDMSATTSAFFVTLTYTV
jgi:hypothetical protein